MVFKLMKSLLFAFRNTIIGISKLLSPEKKNLEGSLDFSTRFSAELIDGDKKREATRIVDQKKRNITMDKEDGIQALNVTGESPKGEEGEFDACTMLIQYLNKIGQSWSVPRKPEPDIGIDCIATDTTDNSRYLKIQVTRINYGFRKLNQEKQISIQISDEEAAKQLFDAIKRKSTGIDIRGITLAIDVADNPGHPRPNVKKILRQKFGAQINKYGFDSIWAVGYTKDLVLRLDR